MYRKLFFVTIVFFWFGSVTLHSQKIWQQCNGPLGGSIRTHFFKDGTLYTTSNNGVYLSTDNGSTFQNWGLRKKLLSTISSDSDFVYAADWYYRLYRKKYSAGEWEEVQSPATSRITELQVYQSGALIACTRLNGIFISFDQGESWKNMNNNLPSGQIYTLLITGSGDLYTAVEFLGIFKSTDIGLTWSHVSQTLPSTTIRCLMEDTSGNIYAGAALYYNTDGGIYRSTNQGETWGFLGYPYDNVVFISQASNGDIYFGSDHGFYRSTDGLLWTKIGNGLFQPQYNAMSENDNGDLFVSSFSGIFKSTDCGSNFNLVGLPVKPVFSFTKAQNGNSFVGTTFGVWESSDMGQSWINHKNVTQGFVYSLIKTSAHSLLAGLELPFGIFKKRLTSEWYWVMREEHTTRDIKQASSGIIYTASTNKLYKSIDDGETWLSVNTSPIPDYLDLITVESEENKLYLGTNGGGVYTSADSGLTWQTCNNGLGNMMINFLLKYKENILAATDFGVFMLSDETWQDINSDLSRRKVNHLFAADSFFYAATDSGIYSYSYYTGEWNSLNEGLNDFYILSLGTDRAGHLLAGTVYESVYRLNVPVITDAEENNFQKPDNFLLSQNYPNPFNPSTRIKFSISEQTLVSINIYDILGRLVSEIISEEKSPGEYEFVFDGKNLPSGIYICRMSAGKFSQTIKMTLTK